MMPNIHRAKNIKSMPKPRLSIGSVAIKLPIFAYRDFVAISVTPQERILTPKPIATKVPAIPKP